MYRNTVSHTLLSYLLNIFKEFFKNHSSGHQCYFFRFGLLPFPKISKITNYIMYGNYQFDYHISSIKILLLHISEYIWPCTKQSIDQSFFFCFVKAQKYWNTGSSYPYLSLIQTVAAKLEAHNK